MCPSPSVGRPGLKAVRLSDIAKTDPGLLERAKNIAMKREDSFTERLKIGLAAERPSDAVYWVPRPAWDRVMGKRRGAHR